MKRLFVAATFVAVLFAGQAQADVINYTGLNKNMGTVHAGQTGTMLNNFSVVNLPFG